MPPISKKRKTDNEDIAALAASLITLKANMKVIEKDIEQRKAALRTYTEEHGRKDGKGNVYVELRHGTTHMKLTLQKVTSTILFDDAVEIAKEIFADYPDVLAQVVKTTEPVEYIDVDALTELVENGEVVHEEVIQLAEEGISWKFVPKQVKAKGEDTDEEDEEETWRTS